MAPFIYGKAALLTDLVAELDKNDQFPIEIDEICATLVRLGVQDEICISDEEMNVGKLRGAFYQWLESNGVYAEPTQKTLIVYPTGIDEASQRLICAKELVHLCDKQARRIRTPEQLDDLTEKLLGPFETGSSGIPETEIVAATDLLAQYQAISLLFPPSARSRVRKGLEENIFDLERVVKAICLPEEIIVPMLEPDWEDLLKVSLQI